MSSLLIVSGELSGFNYVRELVPYLKGSVELYGALLAPVDGVELVLDTSRLTAFGLFEVISKLPEVFRARRRLVSFLREKRPDAVLLVDFPGFNLWLAREAKRLGIRVSYFIPPKLWAWGERRVKVLKECVEKVFVIFPFEEEFYLRRGVNALFIGNPLVDMVRPKLSRQEFASRFGLEGPFYALLPGSRPSEMKYLLRPLLQTARELKLKFALPIAESLNFSAVEREVLDSGADVTLVPPEFRYDLLYFAEAGIVASGTASLEAAIAGLPHLVVYRLNRLTYAVAKRVVKLPYVSLPNIVAGREVVPELLQDRVRPECLVPAFKELLGKRDSLRKELQTDVKQKLSGGAIERLALELKELLEVR